MFRLLISTIEKIALSIKKPTKTTQERRQFSFDISDFYFCFLHFRSLCFCIISCRLVPEWRSSFIIHRNLFVLCLVTALMPTKDRSFLTKCAVDAEVSISSFAIKGLWVGIFKGFAILHSIAFSGFVNVLQLKKKQFFCINFNGGALATWNVRHVLRVVRYIKWCNRALEKGCPWSTFPCPFVTIHRDGIFCFVRKLGCIQLALVNKGQDLEIQTRRQIKKPHFSLKELCWIYTMLK